MPADYDAAAVPAARILRFFTITDIHITDFDSPAQAIVFDFKGGISDRPSTSGSPSATPATEPSSTS